jgi:hypothetical protein
MPKYIAPYATIEPRITHISPGQAHSAMIIMTIAHRIIPIISLNLVCKVNKIYRILFMVGFFVYFLQVRKVCVIFAGVKLG